MRETDYPDDRKCAVRSRDRRRLDWSEHQQRVIDLLGAV